MNNDKAKRYLKANNLMAFSITNEDAANAMSEYAQQEAMAFAEWIANNDYEWSHRAVNPRLWSRGFDEDLAFTTAELWELFNKQ